MLMSNDVTGKSNVMVHQSIVRDQQCFFFSRNIGKVTPKIIYIHYLSKYFPDQSVQKTFYLILKKEALVTNTVRTYEPSRADTIDHIYMLMWQIYNRNLMVLHNT